MIWSPNEYATSLGMGTAPRMGLIADEVQAQFPELVFKLPGLDETMNYKGIDYSKISAVLIEAIKELDTKLTTIENQLG